MTRVSIGLPVWNGEKYVREAIECALSQTFGDFELIISDNASTDRTAEICQEYASRDKRVRFYRNSTNLGVAKNFCRTIDLSTGEFFKFLAADDGMEPEFLEKTVELLDHDPSLILVGSDYMNRNEIGETVVTKLEDLDYSLLADEAYERFREYLFRLELKNAPFHALIRIDVLRSTDHLQRPYLGADTGMVIDLLLKGKFGHLPLPLLRLRTHPEASHMIRYRSEAKREGAAEMRFYDPQTRGRVYLAFWGRLWKFFLMVLHSEEGVVKKARMTASLLHYFATTKYRWLISELIYSVGLGPSYRTVKRSLQKIRSHPGDTAP